MARCRCRLPVLILTLLLWSAHPVHSFETSGNSWPDDVADYRVNANFPSGLGGDEDQQVEAIRCSADSWHNQGMTPFVFDYKGTTTIDELDVEDGVNVVFYTSAEGNGGTIAATLVAFDIISDELIEFDIVFYGDNASGEIEWNGVGDPSGDEFDIIATAAHEFGHALGLGHSDILTATMYSFDNGVQARVLHSDDVAGVQDIYGEDEDIDPAPLIETVDPASGPVLGGTEVVITGTNFTWQDDTVVFIDGDELGEDEWELDSCATLLIPSMPAHTAGLVDIEIENELGSVLLEDAYEYEGDPPEITGVTPGAGPVAGGTSVVVLGTGFDDDAEVTIGGEPLTDLEVENSNRIRGLTPAGDAGPAEVVVRQLSGEVTLEDGFLYATDLLRVEDVEAAVTADAVEVGVLASNELELDGYSFGIDFDSAQVTISEVTLAGTDAEDAAFLGVARDNEAEPDGGFWTIGVVMEIEPPLENLLPAGEDHLVAIGIYELAEDVEAGTTLDLAIVDGLGDPPVDVEFIAGDITIVPSTVDGSITVIEGRTFIRGDANENGEVTLADPIKVLNHIFAEGELLCQDTGDFDNSGTLTLADGLKLLRYLFTEGPEPEPPFPDPGVDPGEPDDLICE